MGWNMDTLLAVVAATIDVSELGEDSDGQLIIYTGYRENENGDLVKMEDERPDDSHAVIERDM